MSHWFIYPSFLSGQRELCHALSLQPAIAQVLINRGIDSVPKARDFLEPKASHLPGPLIFPDMEKAVLRIADAIKNNEKIAIYGDYDVDGITSMALMVRFFKTLGLTVLTYIPNRLTCGYGLHIEALQNLAQEKVNLVITVDCGTNSLEEIKAAKNLGMDIIVTDHHETGSQLPDCLLLNPKREDLSFPQREIAGCAMAYLLCDALQQYLKKLGTRNADKINLEDHLDLVALGTIADIVPLTGINRTFAKLGLTLASNSTKPGIISLIEASGLKEKTLKTSSVAFRLAPRINAAGRLGEAGESLELLITDDPLKAGHLAQKLNTFNLARQRLEEKVLEEALQIIEDEKLYERSALVVASKNWHPGVIGIVASKLVDRFALPAVVISYAHDPGRGSIRSVYNLNVVDALNQSKDHLDHFGGHAQAAGLTIYSKEFKKFRKKFEDTCEKLLPADTTRTLTIDALLKPEDLNFQLAKEIELLEPFGPGNPEPTFCLENLAVTERRVVGNKHLKLKLVHQNRSDRFDSIGFGMGDNTVDQGNLISLAFTPQINVWNGLTSLQLVIKDILCSK